MKFSDQLRRIIVLGLCLAPIVVVAQQKEVDSLQAAFLTMNDARQKTNTLIRIGKLLAKNEPLKAKRFAGEALALAERNHLDLQVGYALNVLGGIYYALGRYDSSLWYHRNALRLSSKQFPQGTEQAAVGMAENFIRKAENDSASFYLSTALTIIKRSGDSLAAAGLYNSWGNLELERNNFSDALDYFIRSAKLYETMPLQKEGLSKALVNIGNIENILGHSDKALDYTNRSLAIFRERNDAGNLAYCYKLLGRIYRKKSDYPKSLAQYKEAIGIYKQTGALHELSETYHGIGSVYYDMKDFGAALKQYEASLKIARTISDENQMAYVYNAIAFTYYELDKANTSIAYFDSSLVKARQIHNRYLMMDAYQILSELFEKQNKSKEALRYIKAYTVLNDSLINEENGKVLVETESRYESTRKQTEIELLKKDQQLQATMLKQSHTLLYGLVLGVLLLIVIGLLLFNRYRLITNTRRQLEIEKMRHHIGRDLHDDIGSTLSTIHIISEFAVHENKPENFVRHFQLIGEQSSRMLENMADMVWSINPANDSVDNMLIRMREFCAEILEPKNIEYLFEDQNSLADISLTLEQRKNFFLIFKECINNAAKYSNAAHITIRFFRQDHRLTLEVTDDGRGYDEALIKVGNGLRNMRERARDINATLELRSAHNKGTFLSLTLTT